MALVELNKKIKDYSVCITSGDQKKISELCGPKGLVLYFYPKDDTPGCTTEACDFRDEISMFKKLGYGIAGVSSDSVASHQSFSQKYNFDFPLIADDGRKLATDLGVYGEKKLYGKIVQGITRTTFVLDANLSVIHLYKNVRAKGHVGRILGDLQN